VPSEEIIIADSSPLIGLARIGQLGLLPQLANQIIVPRTVHAEVTAARVAAPGAAEVAAQTWLQVRDADPAVVAPLLILVGKGEAEAIALAQRNPSALLLIDDRRARKLAERLGLPRMGSVALLGRAKREGLIPKLKPALDALVANGIFIRQELIAAALKEAGE
jgi:predicted nucleic acid-binding protein